MVACAISNTSVTILYNICIYIVKIIGEYKNLFDLIDWGYDAFHRREVRKRLRNGSEYFQPGIYRKG
jgi:hypothetical protein